MSILSKFMKQYSARIVLMFTLLLLQALGTLLIPTLMSDIVNNGIFEGDILYIRKASAMMLVTAVAVVGIAIAHIYLSSDISARIGWDVRNSIFKKTQTLSLYEFNKFGTASMITRSTSDVMQMQTAFSTIIEMLLPAPFMMLAGLLLTFAKDRMLAFTIIGVMVVILLLALLLSKKAIPMFGGLLKLMDKMNHSVLEKIAGVRVIRAFNRVEDEKESLNRTFIDYGRMGIKINRLFAILMPMITLIMNFCTLLIIGVGDMRITTVNMQIGDLYAIMEYAILTLTYLVMGLSAIVYIPRLNISSRRIGEVLDTMPAIAETLPNSHDILTTSEIEFRNVTFNYDQAENPVLSNISFTMRKGQTTAIIGSTGSGKSTLLNLLMRFYEPLSGEILLDGKDIRELSAYDYRKAIGYVPQKAFLFSGTIEDNLHHGNENATEEELQSALKTAQLGAFISSLEDGLMTTVSQGGANFSGGQKQRLAIARAIVRKPSVYVFDDSFSALDYKTDAKLRSELKKETKDAVVLIVAQRVSTIMDAEQIIVLEEGRIVGIGTHSELLKSCIAYAQIAKSQMNQEELA